MADRLTARWAGTGTEYLALRLLPGDDLRGALERAFASSRASAGFVAASVGSLAGVSLRFAERTEGSAIAGPLEIVSLSGTLSPDGAHLHLSVADGEGRVTGGHLLEGCPVRTTAEVVLGLTSDVRFARRTDSRTGWAELFFGQE